jgi:hypothetical protein
LHNKQASLRMIPAVGGFRFALAAGQVVLAAARKQVPAVMHQLQARQQGRQGLVEGDRQFRLHPQSTRLLALAAAAQCCLMTNARQGATGAGLAERESAISLDWARKAVTVLDCGIEDLLEVQQNPSMHCQAEDRWLELALFMAVYRVSQDNSANFPRPCKTCSELSPPGQIAPRAYLESISLFLNLMFM